jgi:hypothetical protein
VHEYGHAVDRWVGQRNGAAYLSEHAGFKAAVARDVAKLGSREKFLYGYTISSHKETFAEVYASLTGVGARYEEDSVIQGQRFPATTAWVKRALKWG